MPGPLLPLGGEGLPLYTCTCAGWILWGQMPLGTFHTVTPHLPRWVSHFPRFLWGRFWRSFVCGRFEEVASSFTTTIPPSLPGLLHVCVHRILVFVLHCTQEISLNRSTTKFLHVGLRSGWEISAIDLHVTTDFIHHTVCLYRRWATFYCSCGEDFLDHTGNHSMTQLHSEPVEE